MTPTTPGAVYTKWAALLELPKVPAMGARTHEDGVAILNVTYGALVAHAGASMKAAEGFATTAPRAASDFLADARDALDDAATLMRAAR